MEEEGEVIQIKYNIEIEHLHIGIVIRPKNIKLM